MRLGTTPLSAYRDTPPKSKPFVSVGNGCKTGIFPLWTACGDFAASWEREGPGSSMRAVAACSIMMYSTPLKQSARYLHWQRAELPVFESSHEPYPGYPCNSPP